MKHLLSLALIFTLFQMGYSQQDLLLLKTSGKVVIGDTSQISTPGPYNLYVQNGVLTEKVKVAVKTLADWSDESFSQTPEISTVKASIESKSHLYNMPSAEQLVKEGYELQAMDAKILEQVEWLWQYTIKLSEENKNLKIELEKIKMKLDEEEK